MTAPQLDLFPLPPVRLRTPWVDLLGAKRGDTPDDDRRRRWNRWVSICRAKAPDQAAYWQDVSACVGCKHLDGDWCRLQELPATVNPYLTIKHGMGIGMACMGAGKETK